MVTREWEIFQKLLNEGTPWQEAIKLAGLESLPIERPKKREQMVSTKQQKAIRGKHG